MSTFKTSTLWIKRSRYKSSTNGCASKGKISYIPTRMTSSGDRHEDKGQVKMRLREAFPLLFMGEQFGSLHQAKCDQERWST